ncbi:RHS repeat-associated core domain-containing protein [Sphaerisporangium aureirubrum]|uniref:RHS repeat-associated core domain-containing protein n=1 Tax=Sphaerisporangium aureirubrum TaxID=1544736 RepID=UPI00362F29D0
MALLVSAIGVITDLVSPPSPDAAGYGRSVEGRPIREVAGVTGVEDAPAPARKAVAPVRPAAGTAEVAVGASVTKAAGLPVSVARAGASSPGRVRVETLGADVVRRLGGTGLGVRLVRSDGGTAAGRVRVALDYSAFAPGSPGAAARLGVIEMPACLLAERPDTTCAKAAEKARVVPSHNDGSARQVVAEVEAAAADTPSVGNVYVLASAAAAEDPGAGTTNFAATDLKAAGSWQVGLSGGGFSYSYPIPVPPAVAGDAPDLALSYSSSGVDGLTNYTNNQASVAGMGWEVSTGFIERRFRACSDDTAETTKNTEQRNWKHQCWESPDENDGDPATTDHTTSYLTLSVEGKSSPIVKDRAGGGWKTVEDYGWKLDYVLDVQSGLSSWVVTTTGGTRYRFGAVRDSNWQTAYVGDDPGEPCNSSYSRTGTPGLCNATWRWNLDQEIEPHGNVTDYTYTREENWYCKVVGALCQPGPLGDGRAFRVAYDRGGYLAQVSYGRNTGVAGSAHTAKVVFNAVDRGQPPASGVPWDDDTPSDLNCPSGPADVITACDTPGPAFYISKRLHTIVTSALKQGGGWDEVYRLEAGYKWVYTQILQGLPPAGPVLWLDTLRPVGLAGTGPDIPLPPVDFEATLLDNRADHNDAQGKPRLRLPRVSAVYNGLGGRTDVYYGQANPCPIPSGYPTTGWDTGARDCYQATLGTYYDSGGIQRTSRAVYMKWLVTQVVDRDLVGGSPDVPTRYEYVGTPAWARPFNYMRATTISGVLCGQPSGTYCKTLSEDWDEFRGYQTVRTIKGAGTSPDDFGVTTTTFFRGMYDDPRADGTPKGTRITDFDGNGYDDSRVLAGRTLQEQTWRATTVSGATLAGAGPAAPGGLLVTAAITPARTLARGLARLLGTATLACTHPTWQRFASYSKGAKVTWTGHHWEALQASVSAEPGKVTNAWKDLGDCTAAPTPTPTAPPAPTPTPSATPPGGPTPGGYTEIGSTRYEYTTRAAGDGPGIYDPLLIGTTRQVTREAVTGGFRYSDQRTAYDSYGLPTKVNDYGDTSTAADNTCVTTTYARNAAKWLLDYPAVVERRAGDACTAGALLARTVTLYDGAVDPAGNTPSVGDATETRTYTGDSDFTKVKAEFDGYGRDVSTTDARGKITRTAYLPATGFPFDGVTVTNPIGHTATTWSSPLHGQDLRIRDAAGNDVVIDYDALGRTLRYWTPERPVSGGTPAARVDYTIPYDGNLGQPGSVAKSTMNTLRSGSGGSAVWLSTHTYVDGLGRPRETQRTSPAGGRIVTVKTYDARGLPSATSAPVHNSAAPGSSLLNPALTDLPQWSRSVYDGAGQTVAQVEYGAGAELSRTTTRYFGDRVEVQPPGGGKTVYHSDLKDHVTKVEEWADGVTHHDTTYAYDIDGHMTRMTDANGNVRTFTYDSAGRRVASQDPDTGVGEDHYDATGLLAWTKDGRGQKLSYDYDDLGRKTRLWSGDSGTGTKLAEWVYDTLAPGKLTSSTRFAGTEAYKEQVTGYDVMGRPLGTKVTVPTSEDLLAGSYTFTAEYDTAGAVSAVTMPAAGGLPAEKVTSTFDDLGLARRVTSDLGGGYVYVDDTRYTPTGRLAERAYGAGGKIKRTVNWDDTTGWISRVTTLVDAQTTTPRTAQDDQYFYDVSGRVTRVLDAASAVGGGTPGQSECFAYDGLRRLTAAWTTTVASCAGGPGAADSLGADPYKQQYGYDAVGNMSTLTDRGQTAAYHYPSPGPSGVRPNAVTSITRPGGGTDTYGYDGAGNLTSRSVDGKAGVFQWNELGELSKATVDGQESTMVYDADGERLIRRDPGGKATLYLGSMEIELAGGRLTAKRYYSAPGGATVAMRAGAAGVTWLASGFHGSQQLAVDDTTGVVSRERYLPFGARRGVDDLPFTDRGFLGRVEDAATGLDYLSARYYDPSIAKFISADPLLDADKPQWANPYSYAGNNPVGISDPGGLKPCLNNTPECDSYNQYECKRNRTAWCEEYFKRQRLAKRAIEEAERWRQAVADLLIRRTQCAVYECLAVIDQQLEQLLGFDPFEYYDDSVMSKVAHFTLDVVKFVMEDAVKCTEGNAGSCAMFAASFIPGEKLVVGGLKLAGRSGKAAQKLGGYLGKSIKSCSSFPPGVRVLMADGTRKPIEEVEPGDEVVVYDPETGERGVRAVLATPGGRGEKHLYEIGLRAPGGAMAALTATDTHPFWVDGQGHWFNAADLRPGMRLRTSDGTTVEVAGVRGYLRADQRVHNLTIEGVPTFFVEAGDDDVLVHNGNCLPVLRGFNSVRMRFGNETFLLDKKGMDHILKRHHPKYWDGSQKAEQTFFDESMSVEDVTKAIGAIMRQNRSVLLQKGTSRTFQITGKINGITYVLGIKNGRIGQFYPK